MAVKIRLARGGAKKRPYYRVVIANATAPRDGSFIEKIGTYDPLLSGENENKVNLNVNRVEYWLSQGAQPTERVAKFIERAGITLPPFAQKKMDVRTKNQRTRPTKAKKS